MFVCFFFRAEKSIINENDDLLSINSPLDSSSYQLFIAKEDGSNVIHITNVIQQYVPEYTLMTNTETQVVFSLPARNRNQFGPLYSALEFQKQNFKVNNIKITNPTTGDIYPK